jgi:hypothetical protein
MVTAFSLRLLGLGCWTVGGLGRPITDFLTRFLRLLSFSGFPLCSIQRASGLFSDCFGFDLHMPNTPHRDNGKPRTKSRVLP